MRFFGIVTLAIALLQREGRLTYRALKRGFELDAAAAAGGIRRPALG